MSRKGGSAWQHTAGVYGDIGQQTAQPGMGNLIVSRPMAGGGRNSRRRKGRGGYGRMSQRRRKHSLSRRKTMGGRRRRYKGGGCDCNSGGSDVSPVASITGGSAIPAPAVTSLLAGPV